MADPRQRLAKKLGLGLLSGLVAGLLLGIGGRLAMTAIALAAGLEAGFSLGGTLEVLATGLLIGAPAGLVFVLVKRFLPGSPAWQGAVFGALLFLVLVLVPPPAARSAVAGVGHLAFTLLLFGPLFVAYGVVLGILANRWRIRE